MKSKTLSFLMKYVLKRWYLFVLSVILAAVVVAGTLYIPILFGNGVDASVAFMVLSEKEAGDTVMTIVLKTLVVIGITVVSQFALSLVNNRMTADVVKEVRNDVMTKIHKLPIAFLDSHPAGDTVTKMTADVETLSDGLLMGFTQVFTGVLTILGTLAFMLVLNWKIALVVICVTPLSFFVASFVSGKTYSLFSVQNKARGEQVSFINETVGNQRVVKAFGKEEDNILKFHEMNETFRKASLKATFYSSLTNPSTRFVNSVVYALVTVFGAISIVNNGSLSVGDLTCFLAYASQYTKPFNEISAVFTEFQNALSCAERIRVFLAEDELKEPEERTLESIDTIEFKNISFSYTEDQKLIENFSFRAEKGKRIAIVGPTGCGKTTLINLLMRFYDVKSGEILIDDENVLTYTRKDYRSRFGMVLQETWLRNATIRDNIALGQDVSEEEIINACKVCHAHSFIERLPKGYDTMVNEDGGNLSNGQKQLICIARVMLLNPPVLILDEATSSIDTRTELKVQDAFARLMENKTSFIVAHRLSTIRSADTILVMKDGNIVEQGNHEELMKKGGFYRELYMSQK